MRTTKTFPVQPDERKWFVVDAQEFILGRMASRVATVLRGKHKPIYSPHLDHGDHVVVINAEKVRLTGKKIEKKTYFRHTGFIGGGKMTSLSEMLEKKPAEVVRLAVWGMMPKTRLGRSQIKKLKIYAGPKHPHAAQNPETLLMGDKAIVAGAIVANATAAKTPVADKPGVA